MKKITQDRKEELLKLRKKIKDCKPKFLRQDIHKKKKLGEKWRKPKGLHSKMGQNKKGYAKKLQIGYGSPNGVKGLHKTGLRIVLVTNNEQLKKIDGTKEGIILSSKLGTKKRLSLMEQAEKLKLNVLNIDPIKYKKKIGDKRKELEEAKKELETKKKKKETKDKEKPKEKKEEKKEEEKPADEKERKKQELKEQEKILKKKV